MRSVYVTSSEYEMAKAGWGSKLDDDGIEYVPAMIKRFGHIRIYRIA